VSKFGIAASDDEQFSIADEDEGEDDEEAS
jgi:hypothetical protein